MPIFSTNADGCVTEEEWPRSSLFFGEQGEPQFPLAVLVLLSEDEGCDYDDDDTEQP